MEGYIDADDSVYWGSSLGPYLNSTELQVRVDLLANSFPDLITKFVIGQSSKGVDILGIKLSKPEKRSLTLKYDSLLVGAHHAREAITVIDSLLFVERVLRGYIEAENWANELLNVTNIYAIPLLNPDGLDYTSTFPWQRRNMQLFDGDNDGFLEDNYEPQDINGDGYVHMEFSSSGALLGYEGVDSIDNDTKIGEDLPGGIDLNRNYGYEFVGPGSSENENSETYRGPEPFFAPETSALKSFVEKNRFLMSMSLHSGVEAIIAPWGYTIEPTPDESLFQTIISDLQDISYFPSWDDIGGYGVNGEWGDWMYADMNSIAMTIETYGNSGSYKYLTSNTYAGVWNAFNPNANQIYSQTMTGVQGHLDYYFLVPEQSYFESGITFDSLAFARDGDLFSYEMDIQRIDPPQNLTLEIYDTELGWQRSHSVDLSKSDYHYEIIEVDSSIPDNHLRIFIGSGSRGRSYYFNFSVGQIDAGSDHILLPSPSSILNSSTTGAIFFFPYLSVLLIIVFFKKYFAKQTNYYLK